MKVLYDFCDAEDSTVMLHKKASENIHFVTEHIEDDVRFSIALADINLPLACSNFTKLRKVTQKNFDTAFNADNDRMNLWGITQVVTIDNPSCN